MLRFFRRLRHKLVQDGKFSKYLIYAVGEITLVVIGILIALAINNWNQDRIIAKKEQFYLEGLRNVFQQNKYMLQNLVEVNRLNYQNSKKIVAFIDDSTNIPEKELSEFLYNSFSNEIAYNPNNSFLNELINSGSLEDISNPELRIHLTGWESFIQSVHHQELSLAAEREEVLDLFRSNNASIRTILDHVGITTKDMGLPQAGSYQSNLEIINSREFENNLLVYILTSIVTENQHYEPLMKEIERILALIENEIET
ncbi:hypothetical protein C8P64_0803 [Christiangramia gaetbulicola]|uniref:Uncharacterized protein n=1 Tax=Christiangramia gaetbulicola TaxID=703340 RepID=A0A2T6ALX3_9FLAO|nr:DUF6090 family protein [Christiangramia gaetbulicola]PTX44821.1 hypothetical protein C8P64_0803 [Christiangramia gaetbulicola]